MAVLPPHLATPSEVSAYYHGIYSSLIDSGEKQPLVYPQAAFWPLLIVVYLLIDHRQRAWLRYIRFPLFVRYLRSQARFMVATRAMNPAATFGVGIIAAFGVLQVAALMVCNDCQADFRRIERRWRRPASAKEGGSPDAHSGQDDPATYDSASNGFEYYWQSYPDDLSQRIDWILDAFCSFRGVGWEWQVSGIPPLSDRIETQLHGTKIHDQALREPCEPFTTVSKTGIRRTSSPQQLLRIIIQELTISYFLLDLIRTFMHHDRYFLGYTTSPAPSYLPALITSSAAMTKLYRLLLSGAGIYTALFAIFKLGPLFFVFIFPHLPLFPNHLRTSLRTTPMLNPIDQFGSFASIFDHGLAGWWSAFWHQVFRNAFTAPSAALIRAFNLDPKSTTSRLLGLFTAFILSGFIHASGSYTQLGATHPLSGPFLFFTLQPLLILLQRIFCTLIKSKSWPPFARRAGNATFVLVALYVTAPLLTDDFARGGIWLYEPVAVSPLRGLGFGVSGDGWWCWGGGLAFWRWGEGGRWWESGFAL